MMTGYDIEVVAFSPGEHGLEALCPDCATQRWGALTLEKARMGLDAGSPVSAVRRWEVEDEEDDLREELDQADYEVCCWECGVVLATPAEERS